MSTIGQRIRAARVAAGVRAVDLAHRVGLTPQGLWRIEAGVVKQPRVGALAAIARELHLDLGRLISGVPQDEAVP